MLSFPRQAQTPANAGVLPGRTESWGGGLGTRLKVTSSLIDDRLSAHKMQSHS